MNLSLSLSLSLSLRVCRAIGGDAPSELSGPCGSFLSGSLYVFAGCDPAGYTNQVSPPPGQWGSPRAAGWLIGVRGKSCTGRLETRLLSVFFFFFCAVFCIVFCIRTPVPETKGCGVVFSVVLRCVVCSFSVWI